METRAETRRAKTSAFLTAKIFGVISERTRMRKVTTTILNIIPML